MIQAWAEAENKRRDEAYRKARGYQISLENEGEVWAMKHMRESHARLAVSCSPNSALDICPPINQ